MTETMLKLLKVFFATAINEAVTTIDANHLNEGRHPTFYCDELGEFTGADGRVYVVEVTVRTKID